MRLIPYQLRNYFNKTHVMHSKRMRVTDWNEFDDKLLWCVMDTFQWHIENDMTLKYLTWVISCDEEGISRQKASTIEILEIYNWWIDWKKRMEEVELKLSANKEILEYYRHYFNKEEKLYKEADSYLHKVIDIKGLIWS